MKREGRSSLALGTKLALSHKAQECLSKAATCLVLLSYSTTSWSVAAVYPDLVMVNGMFVSAKVDVLLRHVSVTALCVMCR